MYQLTVPELAEAEMLNESPLQILAGTVEVIVGLTFTVTTTDVLTEVQDPFTAST